VWYTSLVSKTCYLMPLGIFLFNMSVNNVLQSYSFGFTGDGKHEKSV